ncbi:hypothetical protein SAMN05880501_105177 [Ureibacillus xyleni]|uniref:Uncharacterized protein n=1 Tax=Ureibacillus xyleni TaxID=614648 RepID=A0A285SM37_9BACL|nr:hypothetical protein [Ureibacillus xyleni]SOC09087.1 hypothetical protein SAMN05880501_105177 [Ureibacillus xyleni]
MKIGIDFGNKTFTLMRVLNNGIEPVPNILPNGFGKPQEAYPAIFTYNNDNWLLTDEQNEESLTNIVQALQEEQEITSEVRTIDALTGGLKTIRQIIEQNHPGQNIEEVIYSTPLHHNEIHTSLFHAMQEAGWPVTDHQQGLKEAIAAIFGSGLYDDLTAMIGASRTILVLDGKTHELTATIYTVTVTANEENAIHFNFYQLNGQTMENLGGFYIEQIMAHQLKQIAAEKGNLDITQYAQKEWLNLVDYIKNLFLVESEPYIAYDFTFNDGTPWQQPETIDSQLVYGAFRGEPYLDEKGESIQRNLEIELHNFIYKLCDEGGITTDQLTDLVMVGGTFRLPFWRETIQAILPNVQVVNPPDNLSEVAIVGRGCAQVLLWKEQYQLTYTERHRSGNYIGISYRELEGVEKFKPLLDVDKKLDTKSAIIFVKIPTDYPLVMEVYRGQQTESLDHCEKVTYLRFLHTTLAKQIELDYVGFCFTLNEQGEVYYEIQHPYTNEVLIREEIISDFRAKEGQLIY